MALTISLICCNWSRGARRAGRGCLPARRCARPPAARGCGVRPRAGGCGRGTRGARGRPGRPRSRLEPPGAPERRGDDDRQDRAGLVPDAVVVAALDPEHVAAGRQVGVGGDPLPLPLDPVAVEPLEAMAVLVPLRIGVVEGREADREGVLEVLQPQLARSGDWKRKVALGVGTRKGPDDHPWHVGVVPNGAGVEGHEPGEATEEQGAVGRLAGRLPGWRGWPAGRRWASRSGRSVVVGSKRVRPRLVDSHSALSAVGEDPAHAVAREALTGLEADEGLGGRRRSG